MKPISHWNYRVVHEVVSGVHTFTIRECYYNGERPVLVTGYESHVAPFGETIDEFRRSMDTYQKARARPPLHLDPETQKLTRYEHEKHGPPPLDEDDELVAEELDDD